MPISTNALKAYHILRMVPNILFKDPQPFTDYVHLFSKIVKISLGEKVPIYGSVDITNRCNLKCKHCYWWKNWKPSNEMAMDHWKVVIKQFKEAKLYQIALTGGEPLLRSDVIEALVEQLPHKINIITNGTLPLINFGKAPYFVSIDGTEEIHNSIRGLKIYRKIKQNVKDYSGVIFSNTTINTLNCDCIEDLVKEWSSLVTKMNFQFHTPFSLNDKLWLPFGKKRDEIIDRILKLKQECPDLFLNTDMQLNLFRSNEWTKKCPSWSVLSLDHLGKIKQPCCMGGEERPICERCGMCEPAGIYAGLFQNDLEWFKFFFKKSTSN